MHSRQVGVVGIFLVLLCSLVATAGEVRDGHLNDGRPLQTSTADATPIAGQTGQGSWTPGIVRNERGALPYQLFTPELAGTRPLPLVVFLHGSGEAGVDNQLQMYADRNVGPTYFGSAAVQKQYQAYVLAPQTPKKIRWAGLTLHEYDFDTTPITVSMELLLELLDDMLVQLPIDRSRVYVGGLSRGGHGTWNAVLHRPEMFAAAFPMAGGGSPAHAHRIAHLAIWGFHGLADRITPPPYTRRMVEAVYALSPDPSRIRLTEYAGGNHASAWLRGHAEPDFPNWIFQWRNPNATAAISAVED